MNLATNFAKNLKKTRELKKWSQNKLATRAKISVSYVSMLERGNRSAPLNTVEQVAKALKVEPLALLK